MRVYRKLYNFCVIISINRKGQNIRTNMPRMNIIFFSVTEYCFLDLYSKKKTQKAIQRENITSRVSSILLFPEYSEYTVYTDRAIPAPEQR